MLDIGVERVPVPAATVGADAAESSGAEQRSVAASTQAGSAGGTVALGAKGGIGNGGGFINSTYSGDLFTEGILSPGILLQSIGGGGGQVLATGADTLAVTLGGSGGAAGDGGAVSLANSGRIQSTGSLSHAVVLQSIGGGGLVLTDLVPSGVALTLSADNSGSGGAVSFRQTGDVVATGERSIGILAQSIGGGGGAVDRVFTDTAGGAGRSGAVVLEIDGDVAATGAGGVGIFAQSRGRDGQGNITLALAQGNEVFAGAGGVAVWLSGGANNHVVARGLVATADGLDGLAFRGEDGNETIENFGTVRGQFDLGGGTDRFINQPGALLVAGPELKLGGVAGTLVNAGTLQPGGMGLAQLVRIDGGFEQSASGVAAMELDLGADVADQIRATGSVQLGGRIELTLLNPQLVRAGTFTPALFSSQTEEIDAGATLVAPQSEVIQFKLVNPTGKALDVEYTVNFSPTGLGPNLAAVGDYLNRVQNAGSSPALADTIVQLLRDPPAPAYAAELSQLSPEFYGEHQAALLRGSRQFGGALLDGPHGVVDRDAGRGRAVWFQEDVETVRQAASEDYREVRRTTNRVAAGLQKDFGRWLGGVAIGLEHGRIRGAEACWKGSGETTLAGVALERNWPYTTFAATATYAWNATKAQRFLSLTSPAEAQVKRYLESAALQVRLAHEFERRQSETVRWTLRPSLDGGFVRLTEREAHETGAGAQGLALRPSSENHGWLTSRLEGGYERQLQSGNRLRGYLAAGFQRYLGSAETKVGATLLGAPAGVDPMFVPVDLGRNTVVGEAGFELISAKGLAVRLGYQYLSSGRWRADTANLKATILF